MNPITQKDFYKTDHRRQYPEGTTLVYSNFTARSAKHAPKLNEYFDNTVVFFGLQHFIIDFLIKEFNEKFFNMPKEKVVKRYKRRLDNSLGVDAVPMTHIERLHDLGYLPIKIKALPEGSRVNIGVPLLTITNTLREFYWLVNDLETVLICELWKPITTASTAYQYKKLLTDYAERTGSPLDFVGIQGHDFSFRGMSGRHDAAINGAAHLLSFVGTDTMPAIDLLEDSYGANSDEELIGCSVPATEHSVMCMGTKEDEIDTFRRLICDLYPTGIVSIVSDTWNFWTVITEYTKTLKEEIMARQPNSLGLNKVVFRPDSGDPVKILCGYTLDPFDYGRGLEHGGRNNPYDAYYWRGKWWCTETQRVLNEVEIKGAVQCLWDIFGGTTTEEGYRVLDEHVGLIYGDSITLERAEQIMQRLEAKGFASCNVVFGIGSYTYQYVTRDSYGMAMKATAGIVNSELREIYKDPITDDGTKKSLKGLVRVDGFSGHYAVTDGTDFVDESGGRLETVFEDGELTKIQTLEEIRERLDYA